MRYGTVNFTVVGQICDICNMRRLHVVWSWDTYIAVFFTVFLQKPIRKGVISPTLMVEELGRRKVNHGVLFKDLIKFKLVDGKFDVLCIHWFITLSSSHRYVFVLLFICSNDQMKMLLFLGTLCSQVLQPIGPGQKRRSKWFLLSNSF